MEKNLTNQTLEEYDVTEDIEINEMDVPVEDVEYEVLAEEKTYDGNVTYVKNGTVVTAQGEDFAITINGGKITSLKYNDKEYLRAPVAPNYFRALTDNDFSNLNFIPFLLPFTPYLNWQRATKNAKVTVKSAEKNSK